MSARISTRAAVGRLLRGHVVGRAHRLARAGHFLAGAAVNCTLARDALPTLGVEAGQAEVQELHLARAG